METFVSQVAERIRTARKNMGMTQGEFAQCRLVNLPPLPEFLISRWDARNPKQDLQESIITIAQEFRVSGEALYGRLANTGLLSKAESKCIDPSRLSRWDEGDRNGKPNSYNFEFVRRLYSVLDNGLVSVRKAAEPYDLR